MAYKITVVEADTADEMEEACRRLGVMTGGAAATMHNINVPVPARKRHRLMVEAIREIFQNNGNQPMSPEQLATPMHAARYIKKRTKNPPGSIRRCVSENQGFVFDASGDIRLAEPGEMDIYTKRANARNSGAAVPKIGERRMLAIMEVLMEAGGPMFYKDIARRIGEPVPATSASLSSNSEFIGCPLRSGKWGLKGRDEHLQRPVEK